TKPVQVAVPPDPTIEADAVSRLSDPELMRRFDEDIAANGLVGEQNPARTLLLAVVSRISANPLHITVKGGSSAGKNYLVGKVSELLPESEIITISDMTPHALQYRRKPIKGKVVLITEAEGAERAEYPLRIMMSEKKITTHLPQPVKDEHGNTHLETQEYTIE